jgi:hypothetical protein
MQIFLGASSFGGWLWFALVTLDFFTPGVIRVGIAGHIVPKAFKKKTKLKKKQIAGHIVPKALGFRVQGSGFRV